jgi:hypothetical protein
MARASKSSTMPRNNALMNADSISAPPPPGKKLKTGAGRPSNISNFTPEEDVAICRAFVNVSLDPIAGTDRKASVFWSTIKTQYESVLENALGSGGLEQLPIRSHESLKYRFTRKILPNTNTFNSYLRQIKLSPPSGTPTEDGLIDLAKEAYMSGQGKAFMFTKCVSILNKLPRFDTMASKIVEEHDGVSNCASVNLIGPPMGTSLPRPFGTKKAKKIAKQEVPVASPNPSLLEIASAQKAMASAQASIARSMSYNDKRQYLETEFRMLMEIGSHDEAKLVLGKVKALSRELESSLPPLPEVSVPPLSTDDSKELGTVNDDYEDGDGLSICEKEKL